MNEATENDCKNGKYTYYGIDVYYIHARKLYTYIHMLYSTCMEVVEVDRGRNRRRRIEREKEKI